MLNGFQSRINMKNQKYFMQFPFLICTTKSGVSSQYSCRQALFSQLKIITEIIPTESGEQTYTKTFCLVYLYNVFQHSLLSEVNQLHIAERNLVQQQQEKKRTLGISFSKKLKANQTRTQYSNDIILEMIYQILPAGEKMASQA